MNRTFLILSVVTAFAVNILEHTEAAVVGHHPDPWRKSIQRKHGSPSFLLFRRATETEDDEPVGPSLMQQLRYPSEQQEEDNEPHSFMMISTSTYSTDDMSGSDPFGGPGDSPGVVSIGMTIIQLDDSPAIETRKVARRFGSRGPLSIERSYTSYDTTASSDPSDESPYSRSEPLVRNTRAGKLPEGLGSGTFESLWKAMNERNSQVPLSMPTGDSRTEQAEKPKDSYQNSPPVVKEDIPHPFTAPAKEQIVMKSSPTFDNTSHHSQL
ncbi:hypothetical protein PGT21_031118 [Puccinia graminis f. sp. tritici]|uniref:Uncharacterized protein n=2 Tax=Puccinia graminis f. sp. tritici TaxID=56615 RepID=E3K328_PUCGT|nr:uncharacterized protein PGTG_04841 [Puccinia graminis f. sp. tritici CRL 75-36-700-3]EFP78885.2 hypothetical protein PGTG_04841 [Puccinia graminis f. sp. tritici CRL 75-36-700-3]KAA1069666.1 hypothetical protein PGT21_031118 [Puccinia graminis f. sp. tritici]KAA1112214.1 hypothetical protein PGTUg99_014741 [Puccinia graminis f. sp. tritici]